jgi:Uma2 family endonuclease
VKFEKVGEMIQTIQHSITVDQFIAQYGDDQCLELIDGELIDMEPTGLHEQVGALVGRKLNVEIDRYNFAYLIPYRCLIKLLGTDTAFRPDVIVLDQLALEQEPLWRREPVVTLGTSVKLVVEVVSTNWQNDYARKTEDYESLEIPELWIVDYLGLGGKKYIGVPKQPTFSVYSLVNGEYQICQFHGSERIASPTFPDLQLTAEQVFAAGK